MTEKHEEKCGFGCGRLWNEFGNEEGFEDCVSAYHKREKVVKHSEKCASIIKKGVCDCDEYHTFTELYDHRITIYIALCSQIQQKECPEIGRIWRSKRHSDGEICFGTGTQFILGIGKEKGNQISYHIPVERWSETDFAETLENAPEFDGHTSDDVIIRLKNL